MAMPAKIKTWTPSTNNRITYVSVLDTHQKQLHELKEFIKAASGVTVKGSGDNAAAAMDGVDRIASSTEWVRGNGVSAVHSWEVFTWTTMGIELLLEYCGSNDESMRLCYSVAGYSINATNARFSPTAADEVQLLGSATNGGAWGVSTASGDRIWSAFRATDGKGLIFMAARAGVWVTLVAFEEIVSVVVAPATFSPSVVGCVMASSPVMSSWTNGLLWKTRVNGFSLTGGSLGCVVTVEGTTLGPIPTVVTGPQELQESSVPVMPLGLWSVTQVGARGKLGNLIDIHAGSVSASDGDTYPNDVTRTHIAVGDFVFVWDNSVPVMT